MHFLLILNGAYSFAELVFLQQLWVQLYDLRCALVREIEEVNVRIKESSL